MVSANIRYVIFPARNLLANCLLTIQISFPFNSHSMQFDFSSTMQFFNSLIWGSSEESNIVITQLMLSKKTFG